MEYFLEKAKNPKKKVKIGLIGKYIELKDSYKSISEALIHASTSHNCAVEVKWIHAESINTKNVKEFKKPGGHSGSTWFWR